MSKSKSITELITELQEENEQSKYLTKLFNQAIKHEFGYSINELHTIIQKYKLQEKKFKEREVTKQG